MKNQSLRAATILYLLLPSFLFVYGWLKLPFAVIILLILTSFTLAVLIDVFHNFPNHHIFYRKTKQILSCGIHSGIVPPLLLIVVWLAFSGVGGIGFQNDDYRASNALLQDLITQDWPLKVVLHGNHVPIVYYIAYYLPAALVGKAYGWVYANIFLFVWTLVGILLAYAWFWNSSRIDFRSRGLKAVISITMIFCLAGGLDYIGCWQGGNFFSISDHIEPWAHYFEYSSNTTLIFWVPQHTIASWLVIGMLMDALYEKQNLKYLGVVIAAGVIWSPFGLVGAVPYLLLILFVYLQSQHRRYLWNWESIAFNSLSIVLGVTYLLYLGSNQFKFPMGFIWQFSSNWVDLTSHLIAFWFFEFALLGFLILLLMGLGILFSHPTSSSTLNYHKWFALLEEEFNITPLQLCLFVVSLAVLWILPLFKMGINNDLVMRGSIASLFIFWASIAKVIADGNLRVRSKYRLLYMVISIIVIIGFFTSVNEITRSVTRYHIGAPVLLNGLTTVNANETSIVLQRIGSEDSIFYRYFGK